jgi:glycosyltransferase involved in cell wall biosynthesis
MPIQATFNKLINHSINQPDSNKVELTIVMPCLNEEETLGNCIKKALAFLEREKIEGEVLISDNGSTDRSQEIAVMLGARLVHAEKKGYGAALDEGINSAKGTYVILGDSDESYDFSNLMPFVTELRNGCDLVIGNRFKGGIEKGAMPFLHKYIGNPVLSFIGRLFFHIKIRDFHCGLRGLTKKAYKEMNLHTTGMEFASEMVVKAALLKMNIVEVPITLSVDGRNRPPHLRTWHDGWRHLRFLLMFSPKWLFLFPGLFIIFVSLVFGSLLFFNPIKVNGVVFDIHTLIVSSFALLIGVQFVFFHSFVKIYSITSGIIPSDNKFENIFKFFTLERGLLVGIFFFFLGAFIMLNNFISWSSAGFSDLIPTYFVRRILSGIVPFILGIQIIIYSFIFSIIGIQEKK